MRKHRTPQTRIVKEPNHIRHFRETAGLSQGALATKVGTSQQQIQRIETGKQSVRHDLALKICAALGVSIGKVFPKIHKAAQSIKSDKDAGAASSVRTTVLMTMRAVLADATDLHDWAKRVDASALLPQLIRRLTLVSVPAIEEIHFRSDEGIRLAGWDGILQVSKGNAFVSPGTSGWEMSTNANVKGKADEDYYKRVADPLGLQPANSTFVFVTPRRWENKEEWAHTKRKKGIWKDVRVLDADDLSAWLEDNPSVHIWFSKLIGKCPSGVNDLQGFWQTWSGATRPALSPGLLVAGRSESVAEVGKFLQALPSVLEIKADTREEAVAFFASAIQGFTEGERERDIARTVIVEDIASWRQLAMWDKPLILVPTFQDRSIVAAAVTAGHHVFIPLGQHEHPSRAAILLPRLTRDDAKKAFEAMGIASESAGELAGLARRSIGALRRKLAISASGLTPKWAEAENARLLLPALLAGRWDDHCPADQKVLSELAGKEYGQFKEVLVRWANESEPPVHQVGHTWMITSKTDSWALLVRYLSRGDLERFQAVVLDVLGETDPRYELPLGERWYASIHGKVLKRSEYLREGLAETLALLGAYSDLYPMTDTWTGQEWATRIVGKLLEQATDWNLWASLSSHLKSLAEAAPDAFLEAVGRGVSNSDPILVKLFTDTDKHWMESSPHTGLLWALEVLAWSPAYLAPSALLLAKLAQLDPGGKLMNRPIESLHRIFLCWYPGTSANLDQRLRVLDTIRQREPRIAWTLQAGLLPSHDVAHPTAKPSWRDWMPEQKTGVTYAELHKATQEISKRLLEDVGTDGSRWHDLIEVLDDVPKAEFEAAVDRLQILDPKILTSTDRIRIWSSLRKLISRHLEFSKAEADWVLPEEAIERLRLIYPRFTPDDPVAKQSWFFSHNPDLLEAGYSDFHKREEAIAEAQVHAVEELFGVGGLQMMLELAKQVEAPHFLGRALGRSKVLDGQEHQLLTQCLGSSNAAYRDMAMNFLCGRASVKGPVWLESFRTNEAWQSWTPQQRADYYRCLPFSQLSSWSALEKEEDETKRLYWTQVGAFGHGDLSADDSERVVRKFVEYGVLGAAINFLYFSAHRHKAGIHPQLIAEVLEQVVQGRTSEKVDWGHLSHHVREMLDLLVKSGEIEEARLAKLEWFFLPLFRHERRPMILHKALAEEPELFIEMLKLVYRAEGEEQRETTEEQQLRGRLAYDLLSGWKLPPGLKQDAAISSDKLRSWIAKARELAAGCGRATVADHHIGNVLIHYPVGSDEAWPHEVLRDLLEEVASEDIEDGIRLGIYNSRGVVSRSLNEGGSQERAIAERYSKYARVLNEGWPRTARLMRRIAQNYESEARREDIETEIREDLWD